MGAADTELMRLGDGWVAKGGAEGLLCAARDGLGIALKVEDGGTAADPHAPSPRSSISSASTTGDLARRSGRELARRGRRRASRSPERRRALTKWSSSTDRPFRTSIRALWWWSRGGRRAGSCMSEGQYPVRAREEKAQPMLSVDIALPEVEELQRLVEQGLEKGFLTYDEIVVGPRRRRAHEGADRGLLRVPHRPRDRAPRRRGAQGPPARGARRWPRRRRSSRSSTSRWSRPSTRCVSTCARSARCRC